MRDDHVRAIGFNYGQNHIRELHSATEICAAVDVPYTVFDLDQRPFLGSALTGGPDVPHGHYADENMKMTIVPNRNAVLLATAFAYAVSIGATRVAIATHAGDHPIYPDCRPSFMMAFQTMQDRALGEGNEIALWTPYINISKASIVETGYVLGVPYEKTWSCYEGGEIHCGRCGTCVERKEAFREACVIDPTSYRDEDFEVAAYRG
jgi:7-cyano-7-deazaguanine synthase